MSQDTPCHEVEAVCPELGSQGKAVGTLTRKRYNELKACIKEKYNEDTADDIMYMIERIFKFDPKKSTYTKELGQKYMAWRKEKSKETGLSLYVLSGGQKNQEKKKALKNLQ